MNSSSSSPSSLSSIRIIEFGDGRLNPLSKQTRAFLFQQLEKAERDDHVRAIILVGQGHHNFSAGADLTEFSDIQKTTTTTSTTLVDLVNRVEACEKPVVAAITGACLGGGLELALACHYRVSSPSCILGLPEVTVGVIPGAGGTQRLSRMIGARKAMNMIVSGKPITSSTRALELGLVDAISSEDDDESLLDCARKWAQYATLLPLADRRLSNLHVSESPQEIHTMCEVVRKTLPARNRGGESVHCAVDAIEACCLPFEQGMQKESELFLKALSRGHGQRHAFFAVRAAQKMRHGRNAPSHAILNNTVQQTTTGVIGAGTMGSGIALVLLQAGYKVCLVDIQQDALERGVLNIQAIVGGLVKKQKLNEQQAKTLLSNLSYSTNLQDLSDCLLVVEAVVENLDIKRKIFSTLNEVVKSPTALLLSNTSTLDIDEMSQAMSEARRPFMAGWHFFSPAHMMKLVEIVVGKNTSDSTVAVLQTLTKRIKKIGVVVGNCNGFVGNRMLQPYSTETVLLLSENDATVESVDKALYDFGMAMGPFVMSDLAGNDIGYFIRKERGLVREKKSGRAPNRPSTMRYTELADDLVSELGRVGQKALKGWYDYDKNVGKGRKPLPSREVSQFIRRYVAPENKNKRQLSSEEIVERVLFPLVNEGFKILEEGIADKPSDIDVIYLYGYGWPSWRGGPMFWADHEVSLPYLLETLKRFSKQYPGSEYFVPSRLLETCVSMNVTVEEYYKRGLNKINRSKL